MPSARDRESLLELTRAMVRVPSRSGIDPYGPVYDHITAWLRARNIVVDVLFDGDVPITVTATVGDPSSGPTYLLIATADTAEFGDESAWTAGPLSGEIRDGWLYGRGSADSKSGIAIFCHVATALLDKADELHGAVTLVFDAEEHSGKFLGIQRFLSWMPSGFNVTGAMIGYPGQDKLITGCRGVLRAVIRVHGKAAHSGSSSQHGINALVRAVNLVQRLQKTELPQERAPEFPLPAQLTVTGLHGGSEYSSVPDLCNVYVDVRLTPRFDAIAAQEFIGEMAAWLDAQESRVTATEVDIKQVWPAYIIPPDRMVQALRESACKVLNKDIPLAVAGPTSVGNLLALRKIPATAGLGVIYRNAHATDECILIESLEPVYRTYLGAVRDLLKR